MILGDLSLQQAIQDQKIRIEPYIEANLKGASYTFTLGSILRIPKRSELVISREILEFDEEIMPDKGYILKSGTFLLGSTAEKLSLYSNFGCLLSTRGSCAQIGLNVLLSSTFAEPDTDSRLTLEIHNASSNSILLKPGMKIVKGIFIPVS